MMVVLIFLGALSLGNAEKLDRTYLPPSGLGSSGPKGDYYANENIQPNFFEQDSINTTPFFFTSDLAKDNMNSINQSPVKDSEKLETTSTSNGLIELSTPYFYNNFQVPEDLLVINNDISYKTIAKIMKQDKNKDKTSYENEEDHLHISNYEHNMELLNPNLEKELDVVELVLNSKYPDTRYNSNIVIGDTSDSSTITEKIEYDSTTSLQEINTEGTRAILNNLLNGILPKTDFDKNASVLSYTSHVTPEKLAYSYDTSNGIHAEENGTASDGVRVQGSYSYTGDDGKVYTVVYSADENGFQPRGDHLPTPPPTPEAILKVIEQAAKDKENGIFDDGSYDINKYGDSKYYVGFRKPIQRLKNAFTGNRIEIPKEQSLNRHLESDDTLQQSGTGKKLNIFNKINVNSEYAKQYGHINGEKTIRRNEMIDDKLVSHSLSHPYKEGSLSKKVSERKENKTLHSNKNSGLITKSIPPIHYNIITTNTFSNASNVTKRKGYYYQRPEKKLTFPNTKNSFVRTGDVKESQYNKTLKNNDGNPFMTPNVLEDYENNFEGHNINHKQPPQDLLTSSDVLPKITTDTYAFNMEPFELFTTVPSFLNQGITATSLFPGEQKNETSQSHYILSPSRFSINDYEKEKYAEDNSVFETTTSHNGTSILPESENSDIIGPTTLVVSPTKTSLHNGKNYVMKTSHDNINKEVFSGPKQSPKFDSNSGYYY